MSTASARFSIARVWCYWRSIIMVGATAALLGVFWFASRYPQLFSKAEHVGQPVPSMAFSSQIMTVAADAPVWLRILAATVNWLNSMKIGMTFGVLFGALLHTVLRYYPLKIGKKCLNPGRPMAKKKSRMIIRTMRFQMLRRRVGSLFIVNSSVAFAGIRFPYREIF